MMSPVNDAPRGAGMEAYYWQSHHGNFGDDLNLWLWDELLPGYRDAACDVLLVGVGSVLTPDLLPRGRRKLVVGSGYAYGSLPDISDSAEWDIRAVRGPKTAALLGLPDRIGIIDPAALIADMREFQNLPKIHKKSFIPHWESAEAGQWQSVSERAGLTYLDPRLDARTVIRGIAQSELVVAESMHGAILADAFRVPWIAVSTSKSINSFKWADWAMSVGTSYEPLVLPVSGPYEAALKNERLWGFNVPRVSRTVPSETPPSGSEQRPAPARNGVKHAAKQLLAAPATLALWKASRAQPRLSPDGMLESRKDRFRAVLADIRRDYF